MNLNCSLCDNKLNLKTYNLKDNCTKTTSIPMISLLEKITENSAVLKQNEWKVCEVCYELIDEYDTINVRLMQISNKLKGYIDRKDREMKENKSWEVKDENESVRGEVCSSEDKYDVLVIENLKMHKIANKAFVCQYCNKSFTQKVGLTRHLPLHTGEKKFQCETCGKRFVHHTSFSGHCKAHKGLKLFKCDLCGQHFSSSSHLKRHTRIHTKEKRFSCEYCNKKFTERYNLVTHQKLHEGKVEKIKLENS